MSGAITATTLATVAGISAAGSIGGALISSNAAGNAADAQTAAANKAADLQQANSKQALDFQKQQFQTSQDQQAPYLAAGAGGLNALQYGLGTGGTANGSGVGQGSLLTPYQGFTAPSGLDEANDPGYQARLKLGTDAIQKSAAARGGVLTGGTAKALETYGQDYGSNEYQNTYNRAMQSYGTNATNYYTGQSNTYNRLAALAGSGQQQAQAQAGQGQAASNNVTSNLLGTATQTGQDYQNAGAATASGYVGAANAWNGGISGATNNLTNLAFLSQLNKGGGVPSVPNNFYNTAPAAARY